LLREDRERLHGQDYGAYIGGQGDEIATFFVEPELDLPADIRQKLQKVLSHLRIVANNGPATPGGGGIPRRPPALPFRTVK
jgi:hypothetical protein